MSLFACFKWVFCGRVVWVGRLRIWYVVLVGKCSCAHVFCFGFGGLILFHVGCWFIACGGWVCSSCVDCVVL